MSIQGSLSPEHLERVKEDLINKYPALIVRGLLDKKARNELLENIYRDHQKVVKGNEEIALYIVRETVGTGVIEDIIRDESVTDIGYNASQLVVESNDEKKVYTGSPISEEYIVRIIQKFANADGKDFTPKDPILDTVFENIRINAVHKANSPYGTTMSMRVSRPRLALNESNFETFAPDFMLNFFKALTAAQANMAISGETGTGKTEFQKLLLSFIPFEQKIVLIEDVKESHVKEMFPNKDIISWVTGNGKKITDLIKAALRNNPRWIIVSETRAEEAYEMIQAVLSGHHIITTLHAISARAQPRRFVNMAKIGYNVNEKALIEDIKRYFDAGIHIKRMKYKGQTIRYLSEVVEFQEGEDRTIFKQKFSNGRFYYQVGAMSDSLKEKISDANISLDLPEIGEEHQRPLYLKKESHIKLG